MSPPAYRLPGICRVAFTLVYTSSRTPATSLLLLSTMVPSMPMCTTFRATLLPFLTATALLWYSISTMRGASRLARLVAWLTLWALYNPSVIVDMSTTKRRGCIISGADITILAAVTSSTWTQFCSRGYCLAISRPIVVIILFCILTVMVATFLKML